jgi:hypothetical protein
MERIINDVEDHVNRGLVISNLIITRILKSKLPELNSGAEHQNLMQAGTAPPLSCMYNTLGKAVASSRHFQTNINKTEMVYSSEDTDNPKVFFKPQHLFCCCINAILDHCYVLHHYCSNVIHKLLLLSLALY